MREPAYRTAGLLTALVLAFGALAACASSGPVFRPAHPARTSTRPGARVAAIRRYLAVAHRYRMLLVLDLQPGRSSFLRQAKALRDVLLDPSVGLGLDPEWKVAPGQRPGGGLIGSSGSGDINDTVAWVG